MATFLNINSSVKDEFFRYKMPKFILKIEGKKTIITNLKDVAKVLDRPRLSILNYFGCKLGTQSTFDEKNKKFFLKGIHDSMKLQVLLNKYIQYSVLCARCSNPETDYTNNCISCKACGFVTRHV